MNKMQALVLDEYVLHGFMGQFNESGGMGDIAELGLIVTEIAEAMEAVRDGDYKALCVECADILIRTLNFMSRKEIDAEKEIILKNQKNMLRLKLHGRQL